jgi:hypothetical protein
VLGSFDDLEGLLCTTSAGAAGTVKLVGALKSPVCAVAVSTNGRFFDLGPVVLDTQTGLQWEKKVAGGSFGACLSALHGVDSTCTWFQATGDWINAVNAANFAGFGDWRVPTKDELTTILLKPFPCGTSPCIEAIFGPTASAFYWSATELDPSLAFVVSFASGVVSSVFDKNSSLRVRAVRGGP